MRAASRTSGPAHPTKGCLRVLCARCIHTCSARVGLGSGGRGVSAPDDEFRYVDADADADVVVGHATIATHEWAI